MIPFLDLRKINAPFEAAFQQKFRSFLDSGYYVLGNAVATFEKEFAAYCGSSFCVGTGNGLDALILILRGYIELGKLKKGDSVIVAANTYIATILAIKHAGLKPILVEPDEKTFNLDPAEVAQTISSSTKAILATHLYGQLAEMELLKKIAEENDLLLIADAAQAHGVENKNGEKSGSLADAAGFSFYPSKNLGALGDAGAVLTNDAQLAEMVSKLRNYGTSSKYVNELEGFNSRLDELQAIFLSEKLNDLDQANFRRRKIAERYLTEIKNEKINLPFWDGSKNHVFHLFVVRVADREKFCDYLEKNGVGYLIHYPIPPHRQKALPEFLEHHFPITEKIHEEVMSIPLHPALEKAQVDEVNRILNNY